jgi:hypothetical protein
MGERTNQLDDYDRPPYRAGDPTARGDATNEPPYGETAGFTGGNFTAGSDLAAHDVGGGNIQAGADTDGEVDTDTTDTEENPDQIRGDIEQTRAQMSQTVDEIQDRLSPQRLVSEAKDTVREATIGRAEQVVSDARETARGAGQGFLATIRENPMPAALAGLGLGWLIYKSRENMPSNEPRYAGYRTYEAPYQYRGRYDTGTSYRYGSAYDNPSYRTPPYRDEGPSAKDRVQDKAGQVTDQAQQMASQAGDKMQQAAGQAQDTAGQLADQAQYQAQRARNWLECSWDENPLAMSALALAAGAVVGLALPETQPENQLMGPARDNLMQKTQDVTQDIVQNVQAIAQQATDAAKDAAKQEAQNQGLTQQTQP